MRLVSDQEDDGSNRVAPTALFRSLINLHCDCVMLGNRWKLSNLSNTCPHDANTKGRPLWSKVWVLA